MGIVLQQPHGKLNYYSAPAGVALSPSAVQSKMAQERLEDVNAIELGAKDIRELNSYRNPEFEKPTLNLLNMGASRPTMTGSKGLGKAAGSKKLNYFTSPAGTRQIRMGAPRSKVGSSAEPFHESSMFRYGALLCVTGMALYAFAQDSRKSSVNMAAGALILSPIFIVAGVAVLITWGVRRN